MESLKKRLERDALKFYNHTLTKTIPNKIKAKDIAKQIVQDWVSQYHLRKASVDKSFPLYVRLTLEGKEDLCEEGMLFLEEVEEKYGFEAKRPYQSELRFELNEHLHILFIIPDKGKCQIIEKVISHSYTTTERSVVCP